MSNVDPLNKDTWRRDAACYGERAIIFAGTTPRDIKLAKQICGACEVHDACDEYAEQLGRIARDGYIYAGLTEGERQARARRAHS